VLWVSAVTFTLHWHRTVISNTLVCEEQGFEVLLARDAQIDTHLSIYELVFVDVDFFLTCC
jgi:hypothetical protein